MRRALTLLVCVGLALAVFPAAIRGDDAEEQQAAIPDLMVLPPSMYMSGYAPHMGVNSNLASNDLDPAFVAAVQKKKKAKKEKAKEKKKKAEMPAAFDTADYDNLPTDKQLDGDVVRLRYAPGATPDMSEESLPKGLLPPPGCTDSEAINDIKLWNVLTSKITSTKQSVVKYAKWLKAADASLKKVKSQVSMTKKNKGTIEAAIKNMIRQRREIVKRLKTKKLKRDLDVAEEKMKQLKEYGAKLGATKASLVEGTTSMKREVGTLERGVDELRKFGVDPEDD
jgi:hypothetical protein